METGRKCVQTLFEQLPFRLAALIQSISHINTDQTRIQIRALPTVVDFSKNNSYESFCVRDTPLQNLGRVSFNLDLNISWQSVAYEFSLDKRSKRNLINYMSFKGDIREGQFPKKSLPDASICRARRSETTGLVYCLVSCSDHCEHVGLFDEDQFCFSPKVNEILARTSANPRSGS